MCRIVGLFDPSAPRDLPDIVAKMRDTMAHGGPDGYGLWSSENRQVILGHRHLSIIGPIARTSQPMASADGRYVITFNGEILNFRSVAAGYAKLGHNVDSESDTALFLLAWSLEGVACLHRFHGFFAAAIYDTLLERLSLVTDRVGIKPLYRWHGAAGKFAFASEVRALCAHPEFSSDPEPAGLRAMLKHNYIPAPLSIYQGVSKQPPGTVHVIEGDGREWSLRWWDYTVAERQGLSNQSAPFREILFEAIETRMVADVEVGAFLSSGVDSTLLVTVLARALNRRVPVFTCAFPGQQNDESDAARAIAVALGLQHHVFDVTPELVRWALEESPEIWDEPFGDSSAIPTIILSRLTSAHVKCVLSADGGDELFFGYPKYQRAVRNADRLAKISRPLMAFLQHRIGQAVFPDTTARGTSRLWSIPTGTALHPNWPDFLRPVPTCQIAN